MARPSVFITGASAGIGAAAVEVFAAAGYDVMLTARRKERLEAVASQAAGRYPDATLIPQVCDVNFDGSVANAFELVEKRFGKLDVLVNNAGYGVYGKFGETPLDVFRANMETNYFGAIRCTQAALPLLRKAAAESKKKWGSSIVMVSSFVGRRAMPLMSSYSASKFALEGLSESLRVELHDERIAVSVINPGVTQTEFVQAAAGSRPENFLPPEGGMTANEVAHVILKAVARPRRNWYLTGAGKAGMLLQWSAPGGFDAILRGTFRKATKR